MSERSETEIYQAISQIVVEFPILQCEPCAKAVMQWLQENGIEGKILRLKTERLREIFIVSDRHPDETITENGTHYGVEVLN